MKKICYITTIPGTLGFFKKQMDYISQNGYEVYAISSYGDNYINCIGEKTKFIPVEIARGISPLTLKKSISQLKKVFLENNFDIVQYSTPNAAFCASIAAKQAGIKIRNYHLMGFRFIGAKGILKNILRLLEKITCENSTHIECVSKSNLEFGIKEGVLTSDKTTIVWNGSTGGVDMERFDFRKRQQWRNEIRREYELKEDDFVFGFVGRITKDKGIDELLEAYLTVSKRAKLLIVGRYEGVETLNQELLAKVKDNKNVIFCGEVQDAERYFAAIDVLVLPSYREGFGNVIIEAAAVGIPAIISNIPGPVDAVSPDKTAKIVEVKNALALRNAMEEFLDNENLAKEMSANAYDFVLNHFDSEKLNEKILERKRMLLGDKLETKGVTNNVQT